MNNVIPIYRGSHHKKLAENRIASREAERAARRRLKDFAREFKEAEERYGKDEVSKYIAANEGVNDG